MPVRVELDADTETPVSAFLKLSRGESRAFLFESVEGGERSGRFSFLGARPRRTFTARTDDGSDVLAQVRATLEAHRAVALPGLPRFSGGLVGYFAYETVHAFEPRVVARGAEELGFPAAVFMDFDTVVAFDAVRRTVHVIAEARIDAGADLDALYADALDRIAAVVRALRTPLEDVRAPREGGEVAVTARTTRPDFLAAVERARQAICAGDCQQIVLSQRFDTELDVPAFELYRALRRVNPSPYLFFLQDGERALIGSSPETLVRLERGELTLRPLAGTRRRGADEPEDAALEAELRADEKENAEHVMLVDLGRNDVGRVAEPGTVRVDLLKGVERYSHVMHLVSQVRGRLAEGKTALDVLAATFPAGTVSGAPKVRAMELISELEPARRGPYAGALGYFDRAGNLELAITLRTLLKNGRRVSAQAGAGIVFDSSPEAEYQETVNKARALFVAVAEATGAKLTFGEPRPAPAPRVPSVRSARATRMAGGPRVVVIDNYDSFTHNLVQYLAELGADVAVLRNDAIDVAGLRRLGAQALLISPGPCSPNEAGISVEAIRSLAGTLPILGVCLGHQAIGHAFGGRVVRNARIVHGKASPVRHAGAGVFAGLPSPFAAGRYHSLVVERASLPGCLEVTAETGDGEVMGLRHRTLDVEGVQFHPESILTEHGKSLLAHWLKRSAS